MTRAFSPVRLEEALALLADAELGAIPLAGGTDVMVGLHAGTLAPRAVVDVTRLAELRGVRIEEARLVLGAAATFWQLGHDALVRRHAPMLATASLQVGAWQIQNRATLGGNLGTASPAGDSLPVLLALDAELELASVRGRRRVAAAAFHTGYRQLALEPGELIVAAHLPLAHRGALQSFRKVGTRAAQAVSKVSLAFAARKDGGRLRAVRLAAGSVAPVPLRLTAAEQACEGERPTQALAALVASLAEAAVEPIDDVRSTADYRRFVVGRLVSRLVSELRA
jgi:CO/xanthine dehydrogenase FAD-binding subunit